MPTKDPHSASASPGGPAKYENYTIGGTYLCTPPSPDGREYKLLVGVPYSYEREPGRRYPVLYLCDGYWDFMVILGLYGPLWADRAIEEFVIVGLAYGNGYPDAPGIKDRTTDLVPLATDTLDTSDTPCARFLDYITGTFAPFVESEYRIDAGRRVIAGSSIGGTFALLALLRKPHYFKGAIALAPCLQHGENAVDRCEEEFYRRQCPKALLGWFGPKPRLSARVFVGVGGADSQQVIAPAKAFVRKLDRRRYEGLQKRFCIAEGETHATIKGEGFTRGLSHVFAPERAGQTAAGVRK